MEHFNDNFTTHGYLTICNHGGIEIEIADSNDSLRYRFNFGEPENKDLKDNMEIFESEITYQLDEDAIPSSGDIIAGFKHGDTFYPLNEFMRV